MSYRVRVYIERFEADPNEAGNEKVTDLVGVTIDEEHSFNDAINRAVNVLRASAAVQP